MDIQSDLVTVGFVAVGFRYRRGRKSWLRSWKLGCSPSTVDAGGRFQLPPTAPSPSRLQLPPPDTLARLQSLLNAAAVPPQQFLEFLLALALAEPADGDAHSGRWGRCALRRALGALAGAYAIG
jgi:hypothetical protein